MDAETVRRVADRKRAEILLELAKRERRGLDEVATLRFNRR
jgi:flagellar biosynthesis chaperone FliJ